MPRKSTNTKDPDKPPRFKSEAEEADWAASPAGRRYSSRSFARAVSKGLIVSEARTPEEVKAAMKQAKAEGRAVRFKHGMHIKPTDPAVLQEIVDRVNAKQTQAVSLRIPIADLDAAKAIAEKTGIGYQTVLKELISKGLRRAS